MKLIDYLKGVSEQEIKRIDSDIVQINAHVPLKGHVQTIVKGNLEVFECMFLMVDIKGNFLYPGDKIQGYNNKKHTSDKSKLYETGIITVSYPNIYRLAYGDTFEWNGNAGKAWFWKVDYYEHN